MNTNLNKLTLNGNLIDASAGTGKTYQLANRFIALLAIGVPATQMIALTFTRKAVGEFMARIIRELAQAASSPKEAEAMRQRINSTLSGRDAQDASKPAGCAPLCPEKQLTPEKTTPDFFREKLVEILKNISALNLSTLDSFFNKVISAHSVELGLGSVSLLSREELEQAQFQALLTLLSHVSGNADYTDAFMTIFQEVSDEKMGSMMETLQQQVNTFFSLYLNNPEEQIWGNGAAFNLPDAGAPFAKSTDELIREHEDEINTLSQEESGKAFRSFIKKMKSWQFSGMRGVEKAFDNSNSSNAALSKLVRLARPIYEQRRYDILRRCLQRSRRMAQLMQTYRSIYKKEVTSTGKLVFDDITRAMPELLNKGDMDVQRRLDFRLRHWMLDEFQDTSPQQWKALEPLLKEAISKTDHEDGHSNHTIFVVGDEKQSIYGWRGASPELFRSLKEIPFWANHLKPSSMSLSYRSAPTIMDFVNLVFQPEISTRSFPKHASAKTDMKGYVRVTALPAAQQAEQNEQACAEIGRILMEDIRFAEGGVTAAILVRQNADGLLIQQWLKRNHPELPVALLSDKKVAALSPIGEMLLCFFCWLQHPSDSYCYSVLRESPLWAALSSYHRTSQPWSYWRNELDKEGYATILNRISFALNEAIPDATLREWMTAAMAFDGTGGSLEEWILYIANKSRNEAPPKSSVHIMTMHKSKGLEYDAVILPLLSGKSLCDTSRLHYLEARDDKGLLQGILLPPGNNDQRAAWPELEPHIENWKNKQLKESRNLLYVALTRAAHANYIILNGNTIKSDDDTPTNYGSMICKALGIQNDKPLLITNLYDMGSPAWRKEGKLTEALEALPPPQLLPPTRRRTRVSPSKAHGVPHAEHVVESGSMPDSNTDGTEFGIRVHACWEEISWLHEPLPQWVSAPSNDEQRIVANALQQDDVRALFTTQPGQQVYNEQCIEAINTENEWVSGSIDRLVLSQDEQGYVTSAHIIDFKTNKLTSADASAYKTLKSEYTEQMKAYRELIAQAFELPTERIAVSLLSCPKGHPAKVLPFTETDWTTNL